ncbi:DUF1573 domain-containing protein [Rurimicrobium arvi]
MYRTMLSGMVTLGAGIMILASCSGTQQKQSERKGLDASLVNNPHSANGTKNEGLPTMDFVDTAFDFGRLHEGEASSHAFHFTNHGTAPLLIANAAGTCGCTIPDYPHEPIAPGKSGVITVKFNSAGKVGSQHKSVNIFTNSNKGKHVLNITAEVLEGDNFFNQK